MVLCCLIVFMAQMATTVYLPSLPAVMRELAMSQSMVEMSISGFVVGAALPVLFWGSAADRWGRRGPLLFVGLYCLTIFGQAVLFPNSMATAVSDAKDHGAHAMALCGFLQQGLAGIAATASVLLHHNGAWTLAVAALGLITLMQVLFQARLRAA
ncbi:hypothetical protein DK842_18635 [Chromobacterium phragmitis]|nr:hypothetical protein DK842_18635 [Chromobacterium phragmitis]